MTQEEWEKVVELYSRGRSLAPEERDSWLASLSVAPEILAEVRQLLENEPEGGFLEPPEIEPGSAEALFGSGLVGSTFGEYVLEREIGRGGSGVVYLARQPNLERRVALKVLPVASLGREDAIERFRREARAAGHLDHPNIVPVLAYGEGMGTFWYAMLHVDGHDLGVEIERQRELRKPPSERRGPTEVLLKPFDDTGYVTQLIERFVELAQAVQHAHSNGVVHRDIKPQNILVDTEGRLHLVDFGLARDERFGTLSRSGEVRGTPSYMSPEQARAAGKRVDHRTDIYSLSVVLYELLALRPPHVGETAEEVMHRIVTEEPPPLRRVNPRVPRELGLVVGMGLEKSLQYRYASAGALADDLLRFLHHETVLARGPSIARLAVQWGRRRGWRLAVGGVGVLGLLLGFRVAEARTLARESAEIQAQAEDLLGLEDWILASDDVARLRMRILDHPTAAESPLVAEFEDRLRRHRDETLSAAEAELERGLGVVTTADYGPYESPLAVDEIASALAKLEGLRHVFPDDAEVVAAADQRRAYPRLDLEASLVEDGRARPAAEGEAVAYGQAIDPFLDRFGPPLALGPLPLHGKPVPPGHYRITVVVKGFGHAELLRSLGPRAAPYALTARVHRFEDQAAALVTIPGGELQLVPLDQVGCLRTVDRRVTVPDLLLSPTETSNGEFLDYLREAGDPDRIPRNWLLLGFTYELGLARGADDLASWRSLPVVAMSLSDARGFAEWQGRRLPLHIELEHAFLGADRGVRPWGTSSGTPTEPSANVLGPSAASYPQADLAAGYELYRESVAPVDDPWFRQGPHGLFHAHGNVMELTESFLSEPIDGRIELMPGIRIALGSYYGAEADGMDLSSHGQSGAEDHYYRIQTGFRTALGPPP